MVIKGSSRAGPRHLANHLLRGDTNERVHILELDSPNPDLYETFRDWQVLASGTRGSKGLYHANIDPAMGYQMTPEQWLHTADVLEKQLGLEGQPRAIVMHEKKGRQHIHVVWQRTDVDEMKLIPDSYNYLAHEKASLQLEQEFGHEHVPGKHAKRDREKQPEFPKSDITHAEWQQAERTGIHPSQRKEHITELYQHSDNAQAFKAALEAEGYMLAKGDRRDYVLVDREGEIYSLGRQILRTPAAEKREFLKEIDLASLPTVEEARRLQAERAPEPEPPKPEQQQKSQPEPDAAAKEQAAPETDAQRRFREALEQREAEDLKKVRDRHTEDFQAREKGLDADIRQKMEQFEQKLKQDRERFQQEIKAQRRGLAGLRAAMDSRLRPEEAAAREAERRKAWADLLARQNIERRDERTRLRQDKNEELDVLHEKQAEEIAALKRRHDAERERYRQDQEAAERRAKEIENERQWRDHWEQVKRGREAEEIQQMRDRHADQLTTIGNTLDEDALAALREQHAKEIEALERKQKEERQRSRDGPDFRPTR